MGKKTKKAAADSRTLRKLDGTFAEWRFAAKASQRAWIGMVALSLGALALGVAAYASFLRAEALTPIPYLWVLWVAGVGLCAVFLFLGPSHEAPARVGELGVGLEQDDKIARTAWWQIESISLEHDALQIKGTAKPLTLPLASQRPAIARIVAEAMRRIPDRIDLEDGDRARIGEPAAGEGEKHAVEAPQITGLVCRATEQALLVERDARLCGKCCALYHREGVPARCLECNAKLRG